jgi:hypothetical protein
MVYNWPVLEANADVFGGHSRSTYRETRTVIAVPFTGDADFLKNQPQTYSLNPPAPRSGIGGPIQQQARRSSYVPTEVKEKQAPRRRRDDGGHRPAERRSAKERRRRAETDLDRAFVTD